MVQESYAKAYDCLCYCIMYSCIMFLNSHSFNWVMPLEHSNVPIKICSYGNGIIDDVADRFGELFRYMLLHEDLGYVFSHG